MEKLKFLFTASRKSHIENFHMSTINFLRQNGHKVDIVAEGSVKSDLVDNSYNLTFRKKIYSPKNLGTINFLSRLIKSEAYDVIISNTTLAGIITRLALPKNKKKRPYHIYICHGYLFKDDNSKKALLYRAIEKSTASKIDLLLTMNREDFQIAKKYSLCENIQFISGMGVNSEKFPIVSSKKINEYRSSLGIDENSFVFLCVGEFSERKNQKLIIDTFSDFAMIKPNSVLLFAGSGEFFDEAQRLAEFKEISHKIHFLGQISDMNILYRSSQVVLSSSHSEGLPFNIMEALECNIPVIASNVKGHKDLIIDGFNGFLFDDNDKRALLEKMLSITDNNTYKDIKQNAFLESKYKSEEATEILLRYYLQIPEEIPTYSV